MQFSKIPGISCQLDIQCTGHHSFCLRRVRASVFSSVAKIDFLCIFSIHTDQPGSCDHQPGGKSCRNIIQHIIQFCRRCSKIPVPVVHITHHGVHGIHTFIGKAQHCAADHHVKQRGNDTVGSILCNGFNCCFGYTFFGQILRVTSHDHRYSITAFFNISGLQRIVDFFTLVTKGSCRQQLVAHKALQRHPKPGAQSIRQMQDQPWDKRRSRHDSHHQQSSGDPFSCFCFRKYLPQDLL